MPKREPVDVIEPQKKSTQAKPVKTEPKAKSMGPVSSKDSFEEVPKAKEGEVLKINVTEKRFRAHLKELGLDGNIFDLKTVKVNSDGLMRDVSFATFSPKGLDDDEMGSDDFNEQCIKDALYRYHTDSPEKGKQPFMLEVVAANEESPAVLAFQIFSPS